MQILQHVQQMSVATATVYGDISPISSPIHGSFLSVKLTHGWYQQSAKRDSAEL